jgi:hypothetical protein
MNNANPVTEIPEIVINDPHQYVSMNTMLAKLVIRSPFGERRMPLLRTRKGGYMVT